MRIPPSTLRPVLSVLAVLCSPHTSARVSLLPFRCTTEEAAEEFMGPAVKEAGMGLLALDEFQVNDPYTAVVLKAFLETLLDAGVTARLADDEKALNPPTEFLLPERPKSSASWLVVVHASLQVVTTANREPGDLDAGVAQQRELFEEFVDTLKASWALEIDTAGQGGYSLTPSDCPRA